MTPRRSRSYLAELRIDFSPPWTFYEVTEWELLLDRELLRAGLAGDNPEPDSIDLLVRRLEEKIVDVRDEDGRPLQDEDGQDLIWSSLSEDERLEFVELQGPVFVFQLREQMLASAKLPQDSLASARQYWREIRLDRCICRVCKGSEELLSELRARYKTSTEGLRERFHCFKLCKDPIALQIARYCPAISESQLGDSSPYWTFQIRELAGSVEAELFKEKSKKKARQERLDKIKRETGVR